MIHLKLKINRIHNTMITISLLNLTFREDNTCDMTIEHIQEEDSGCFKAIENNQVAGKMTYSWRTKDTFVINHTEVDPIFGGRGVGKKLVMSAVMFARENSFKIVPACSFVKALFEKIEAIQDVKG